MQVVKEVLTDTSDAAAPAAFMHFMSWLASQFAHVVKPTSQASLREQSQVHQQQQQSSLSGTAVPLSADFYFFATLLQPLLSHLQHLDAYANNNGAGVDLQMEGTGVQMEAGASPIAASKSSRKVKGHKKEGKQTKGVPAAWHIAAEGAALLVCNNTLIFYFVSSLGFIPAAQDPLNAGSLPCRCISVSVCDNCRRLLPLSLAFPVSFDAL